MSCSGILARRKRESFFGGGTSGLNSLDTLRSFLSLLLLLFLFQLLHLLPLLSSSAAKLLHDIREGRKCAASRSERFSVSSAAAQASCVLLSNRNHSSPPNFYYSNVIGVNIVSDCGGFNCVLVLNSNVDQESLQLLFINYNAGMFYSQRQLSLVSRKSTTFRECKTTTPRRQLPPLASLAAINVNSRSQNLL